MEPKEGGSLLPLLRAWKSLPKFQLTLKVSEFTKSPKLFRLEGNCIFGHMSHAELLDLYVAFEMENYDVHNFLEIFFFFLGR